jgi:hypothetical protein
VVVVGARRAGMVAVVLEHRTGIQIG